MLHLGTGGGITWDCDPDGEWAETELKARRLLRVASGSLGWLSDQVVAERATLVATPTTPPCPSSTTGSPSATASSRR